MKFFHGTSAENAINILRHGWSSERLYQNTWNCSEDDMIYLVSCAREGCYHLALEEGQITAAKNGSDSKDIYVFEFEIPEDIADDYLEDDDSCPGMDDCYTIDSKTLDRLVAEHKIDINYNKYPIYMPMMRPFYLTSLSEEYMNITDEDLLEGIKIANSIYSGQHFLELMSDGVWDYVSYDEGYDPDNTWRK